MDSDGRFAGNKVREANRIVDVQSHGLQIVGKLRRTRHHVAKQLARIALQRRKLRVVRTDHVRHRLNACTHKRFHTQQARQTNTRKPLDKDHQIAIGHLHRLVQLGHRAHAVQIHVAGVFHPRIELRDHREQALFTLQRIQQRK